MAFFHTHLRIKVLNIKILFSQLQMHEKNYYALFFISNFFLEKIFS